MLARGVESALGGPLLAIFRDDTGGVGLVAQRDRQHLVGCGHFQIERDRERVHQHRKVVIADMATVLAEMGGDAVRSGFGCHQRRAHRLRMIAAAGVTDRGDMIDIDAKAKRMLACRGHAAGISARLPGLIAGIAASSGGRSSAA